MSYTKEKQIFQISHKWSKTSTTIAYLLQVFGGHKNMWCYQKGRVSRRILEKGRRGFTPMVIMSHVTSRKSPMNSQHWFK